MKKELKDYSSFKLTYDDIMQEARRRCITEMYAKAQPSANYDDIWKYYEECQAKNIKPESIYDRHYLSFEEYKYILNKYIEAYHLKERFKDDCNTIIRDLKKGCNKDLYIPELVNKKGQFFSPQSAYEKVLPIYRTIGRKNAKRVIDFIKQRRDYYRFDNAESEFSILISMGDSPCTNEKSVINYWKSQGVNLKIDPRHYTQEDFWCEENGYIYEEDE